MYSDFMDYSNYYMRDARHAGVPRDRGDREHVTGGLSRVLSASSRVLSASSP
jgi:hypothetical protein